MGNGIIPRWSQNVGFLLATQVMHGGEAWLVCSKCGTHEKLNLANIIETKNPLWSPWNRRPPCPTCGGLRFINGCWSKTAFVVPFINGDESDVTDLHAAWVREQRRRIGHERA
jgi:hypothetical protein